MTPAATLPEVKTAPLTLSVLKEFLFNEMTPLEMLMVLNKMCEDLLCSDYAEDTMYRNEIIVFQRNITKTILSVQKNLPPNNIHVLELMC